VINGIMDKPKALALLITLFVVFAGFVMANKPSLNTTESLARSTPKSPAPKSLLKFPRDHAQHPSFAAEWWYINMNLPLSNAYQGSRSMDSVMSLSRISGKNHFLISSYMRETGKFSEKTHLGKTKQVNVPLGVGFEFTSSGASGSIKPISSRGGTYTFELKGRSPQIQEFDLRLIVPKFDDPLLWGCTGRISVFSPNDTYYYSVPLIRVTGTVEIDNIPYQVSNGVAWMDHQWFSSSPSGGWNGHYWLSASNGSTNALGVVAQIFSGTPKNTYWVMRKNGNNYCGTGIFPKVVSKWPNGYPKQVNFYTKTKEGVTATTRSRNQIFSSHGSPAFYESSIVGLTGTLNGLGVGNMKYGFLETHLK